MTVPKHLRQFPTREARASLARQLDLQMSPDMQDWEWEVADPERIGEFVTAYESDHLTDDKRFSLMEIILQSFADIDGSLRGDPRWTKVLELLDANIGLHAHSVSYWGNEIEDWQQLKPYLRTIMAKHKKLFEDQ